MSKGKKAKQVVEAVVDAASSQKLHGAVDDLQKLGTAGEDALNRIPKDLNTDDTVKAMEDARSNIVENERIYSQGKGRKDEIIQEKLLPAVVDDTDYAKQAYDRKKIDIAENKRIRREKAESILKDPNASAEKKAAAERILAIQDIGEKSGKNSEVITENNPNPDRGEKARKKYEKSRKKRKKLTEEERIARNQQGEHHSTQTKEQYREEQNLQAQEKKQLEETEKGLNQVYEEIEKNVNQEQEELIKRVNKIYDEVAVELGYANAQEAEAFLNNDKLDELVELASESKQGRKMTKKQLKGPTVIETWRNNQQQQQQKKQQQQQAFDILSGKKVQVVGTGKGSGVGGGSSAAHNGSVADQGDAANDIATKGFLDYAGGALDWATKDVSHAIAVAGIGVGVGLIGSELLDEN